MSKSSYSVNNNRLLAELTQFIASNPHPRELKRTLAVKMVIQNYTYSEIRDVLEVSVGFISKWKQIVEQQGVKGLTLRYRGTAGYLNPMQRQAIISWLKQKNCWNLVELQQHIKQTYDVVYVSKQSYYSLFKEAGLAGKKSKAKKSPEKSPEANLYKFNNFCSSNRSEREGDSRKLSLYPRM